MVKARNRQGFQVQGIHLTEGQKGGLQGRFKNKIKIKIVDIGMYGAS